VGDAVDLDELDWSVGGGDDSELFGADPQASVGIVEPGQFGVDHVVAEPDAVAVGTGAEDHQGVGGPAQLELHGQADLVLHLRTSAVGGLEQVGDLAAFDLAEGLDRGPDQGHPGVPVGDQVAVGADTVDPAGVSPDLLAGGVVIGPDNLRTRQQVDLHRRRHRAVQQHLAIAQSPELGQHPLRLAERVAAQHGGFAARGAGVPGLRCGCDRRRSLWRSSSRNRPGWCRLR